jgi:uroporphyrinogen decarboxylase
MKGRQRILAALGWETGKTPDAVPVMLHNFLLAARENGVTMARFRRDGKTIAETFIRSIETYGTDGVLVDLDTATLAGAIGVPVDFPEDQPARCRAPMLRSLEEVDGLPPVDIRGYFEIEAAVEAVARLKEYFHGEIAVRGNCDQCPFSLASMVRGIENWMMDLVGGNPELVHKLLAYCAEATRQFLGLMAESGADILSNGDSPAGPDLISPAMYRSFAFPYEKEIAGRSRDLGKPYILHICGNTGPILSDMAATGADGFELDYKTGAALARDVFKERATFIGNIDPSGVLALGTPAEVERKTRELLAVFAGNPRFILNAGCAIPAETPAANLRAMIRATRV